MGAKKKPLDAARPPATPRSTRRRSAPRARTSQCGDFKAPPAKAAGEIIEDEDTDETVEKIVAWLDERKLLV